MDFSRGDTTTKLKVLGTVKPKDTGTKVWFKNTPAQTRADGREIDAVDITDLTGVVVGDRLGWDGTQWVESDGGSTQADWMVVTSVDVAGGYVEAVLTF